MNTDHYLYVLRHATPLEDVEASLLLALFAVESLHGVDQVRLDAAFRLDRERRLLSVTADTLVGMDLNRIFAGFLRREFGADAFTVERLTATTTAVDV